jgi:hypothetical protein
MDGDVHSVHLSIVRAVSLRSVLEREGWRRNNAASAFTHMLAFELDPIIEPALDENLIADTLSLREGSENLQ